MSPGAVRARLSCRKLKFVAFAGTTVVERAMVSVNDDPGLLAAAAEAPGDTVKVTTRIDTDSPDGSVPTVVNALIVTVAEPRLRVALDWPAVAGALLAATLWTGTGTASAEVGASDNSSRRSKGSTESRARR